MIRATYSELDGPAGVTRRLSVNGHANYAPAGQDIVCGGASILIQALVCQAAGVEGAESMASDSPDGPRVMVTAAPGVQGERLAGGFELAKLGLALLAERYPDNLRFADTSRRGEQGMVDLQLFAEEGDGAEKPALSRAQERQAVASGTMQPRSRRAAAGEESLPKTAERRRKRRKSPRPRPGSRCWARAKWAGSSGGCTASGPGKRPRCGRATPSSPSGRG